MGSLHEKIFSSIKSMFKTDDLVMEDILKQYCHKRVSLKSLGLRQELQLDSSFGEAIESISRIDECSSPLEKMECIRKTIKLISTAVQEKHSKQSLFSWSKKPDLAITTDDLLPLLCFVIIYSGNNSHIKSNLQYIEHFQFTDEAYSELGHAFVTFQASVKYLESKELKDTHHIFTKSVSKEDIQPNSMTSALPKDEPQQINVIQTLDSLKNKNQEISRNKSYYEKPPEVILVSEERIRLSKPVKNNRK